VNRAVEFHHEERLMLTVRYHEVEVSPERKTELFV
jgi:hypothetical protein